MKSIRRQNLEPKNIQKRQAPILRKRIGDYRVLYMIDTVFFVIHRPGLSINTRA